MKLFDLKKKVLSAIEYLDTVHHMHTYAEFLPDIISYREDSLIDSLSLDYPEAMVQEIIGNLHNLEYDLTQVRGYSPPDGYLSVFLGLPKREAMLMDLDEIHGRERQIVAAFPNEPIWVSGGFLFYGDDLESLYAVWSNDTIRDFVNDRF